MPAPLTERLARDKATAGQRLPALYSYAFLRDLPDGEVLRYIGDPRLEVLIDSGGFTALNAGETIELTDYMAWLDKWSEHLYGYVALDIIGDPVGTDRNLQIMLDAVLRPIPVHVLGDGQACMDQLFQWSDWIACGGLRRPHRGHGSPASQSTALAHLHRRARVV